MLFEVVSVDGFEAGNEIVSCVDSRVSATVARIINFVTYFIKLNLRLEMSRKEGGKRY